MNDEQRLDDLLAAIKYPYGCQCAEEHVSIDAARTCRKCLKYRWEGGYSDEVYNLTDGHVAWRASGKYSMGELLMMTVPELEYLRDQVELRQKFAFTVAINKVKDRETQEGIRCPNCDHTGGEYSESMGCCAHC